MAYWSKYKNSIRNIVCELKNNDKPINVNTFYTIVEKLKIFQSQ